MNSETIFVRNAESENIVINFNPLLLWTPVLRRLMKYRESPEIVKKIRKSRTKFVTMKFVSFCRGILVSQYIGRP
ncbi:hypothetical protein AKJ62_03385 [candidate division MSBL1 archaeon SCGC-AAA259D14]|nr:hypothetical protein AKJ62_03385 [candidate division MSBL1 archaeon SCGC-AAA259D14]